jgi:DNA-binding PadR family transcriptional regulator
MHKTLLILGLLRRGPLYGYELHRIVRAHGELYADLKKANLYYLLDRLAKDGYLSVRAEPGTRGARGERLIYTLTEAGQTHFNALLREVLRSYDAIHTGVEVAIVFLRLLPIHEAIVLMEERQRVISEHHVKMISELGNSKQDGILAVIASDHMLSLIDAELAWLDRSLMRLKKYGWDEKTTNHIAKKPEEKKDE